jgi:hypothetical protein
VVIAIALALCILFLQIRWGLIARELTLYGYLSVGLPYLGVLIVAVIFHAIRTPWLLDTELRTEIEELKIRLAAEIPIEDKIEKINDVVLRGYELLAKCQDESAVLSLKELMEWMGRGMGSLATYVGTTESTAFAHCLKSLPPNCTVSSEEHRTACAFIYPRLEKLEKHLARLRATAAEATH